MQAQGKKRLKPKIYLLIVVGLLVLPVAVIGFQQWQHELERPEGDTANSFMYDDRGYNCSKEIEGEWISVDRFSSNRGYSFVPDDHDEVKKYCRSYYPEAVIEYLSVIEILERDDVDRVIAEYDTTEAWVKALRHRYIDDQDYMKRILPDYEDMNIACVIVVHSPEGTRFFLEDGNATEDKFIEVDDTEFLASINDAPEEDANSFWLGLR